MSDDKIQEFKDFLTEYVHIIEYELVENKMKPYVYKQHFTSSNSSQINQSIHPVSNKVKEIDVFSLIIKLTESNLIQRTYNLDSEEISISYNEITNELLIVYEETENIIETVYRVLDKFPGKEGLYDEFEFY